MKTREQIEKKIADLENKNIKFSSEITEHEGTLEHELYVSSCKRLIRDNQRYIAALKYVIK